MPSKHPNITRLDNGREKGWIVKVNYQNKSLRKLLSDKKHGGKKKAFEAAQELRLEYLKELGKPDTKRRILGSNPHNTSGIRGVRKIWKGTVEVYEVNWQAEPGKTARTTFSVKKYGEEEARRKAIELRQQKELEIYGAQITES